MDINRLGMGHKIAAGAGILLFIVMLILPWWGAPGDIPRIAGFDATVNAWEPLSFIDMVLFVTLAAAIGVAVMAAADRRLDIPVSPNAIVAALGALSTLLVLYRIIDAPHDLDLRFGVFVGLVLCGAITYGAYQAMQEEGVSVSDARDQVAGTFSGSGDREKDDQGGGPPAGGPPAGGPPAGGPPAGGPPAGGPPAGGPPAGRPPAGGPGGTA